MFGQPTADFFRLVMWLPRTKMTIGMEVRCTRQLSTSNTISIGTIFIECRQLFIVGTVTSLHAMRTLFISQETLSCRSDDNNSRIQHHLSGEGYVALSQELGEFSSNSPLGAEWSSVVVCFRDPTWVLGVQLYEICATRYVYWSPDSCPGSSPLRRPGKYG